MTASLVRRDYADPKAGRITVSELADVWLRTTATLKPSTRNSYAGLLNTHVLPQWGAVELRHVSTSGVSSWTAELTASRSASTVRKALGVLRSILDLAVADRRLAVNPATGVQQPKLPVREMRFLSAAELEGLVSQMPSERDSALTLLLGWTGLRFGEAAALRPSDVDLLRRRLRVERAVAEVNGQMFLGSPKTHQARTVAMPPFLAEEVATYFSRAGNDLLFPNRVGTYLRVTNWKGRVFDQAAARAKLTPPPLRVHDLRHTAASLSITAGASVKAVQHQLGHRSATTPLDRYAHLWPDELDAIGSALERLRARPPADSLRTPQEPANVIPLERRR